MKFHVVTIFPEIIHAYMGESIMGRAVKKGLLTVGVHDLRDYTTDKHRKVDDYPYGGGAGMVMKPEPFVRVIEDLWPKREERLVLLMSPQGRLFTQDTASELSRERRDIVLLCGRYEAIDERVRSHVADEEISVGDYVLTGGELPALVIIDAVSRLVPGVLGDCQSSEDDSFASGLVEYPHYTRPEDFRGLKVPPVLLSGNHAGIARWRKRQALRRTMRKRPELFDRYPLSAEDAKLLDEIKEEGDEQDKGD